MTDIRFPSFMSKVCLWINSSNFPITHMKGRGKKSDFWSGKLGYLAHCYLFLIDGDQVIQKVWGSYSAKVYDGHMVEMNESWFDKKLSAVAVLGNTHFHSVVQELSACQMIAPKLDGHKTDSAKIYQHSLLSTIPKIVISANFTLMWNSHSHESNL